LVISPPPPRRWVFGFGEQTRYSIINMETNILSNYVSPEVEVVEIEVEKGFTISQVTDGENW